MSAPPEGPRPVILKLDARTYRLDTLHEHLIEHGYQVVRGASFKEGLRLARRVQPQLIIVVDNPAAGLDGSNWLALQHADTSAVLAIIPLIIIATNKRATTLKVHELPGRVQVLRAPHQLERLLPTIIKLLTLSDF